MNNLFYKPTKDHRYCVHDHYEFEAWYFKTVEEAFEFAENKIADYLSSDGWEDGADLIYVSEILFVSTKTNMQKPVGVVGEDGMDEAGDYWEDENQIRCDYKLIEIEK